MGWRGPWLLGLHLLGLRWALIGGALLGVAHAQIPTTDQAQARTQDIRTAAEDIDGAIVVGVTVQCDVTDCRDAARLPVLKKATGLKVGLPLRPDDVAEAWLRLMHTGLFRDIEVLHQRRGVGATLTFKATMAVIITDLRIEYSGLGWLYPQQFRSEIRKRVGFHKGGPFPPKPAGGVWEGPDKELIEAQRDKIVKLYSQQGYRGTKVQVKATWHGPNDKQARVIIKVREGSQPDIGRILVFGNRAFDYSRITSFFDTGERVDFWREFFGAFGLGRYARRDLREEVKELEQAYRDEGYVAARVRQAGVACRERDLRPNLEGEAACVDRVYPLIRIKEDDRVQVVFEGNEQISDDALAEVLTFKTNGAYDETEIQESITAIEDAYQALAFYYVQVDWSSRAVDEHTTEIRFTIEEGRPVYVRDVVVQGPKQIPVDEVLGAMETKGIAPDGVISTIGASAGVMQDARVINDLLAIRNLYYDQGYSGLQFRCSPPKVKPKDWNRERLLRGRLGEGDDSGPMLDPTMFRGKVDQWVNDPVQQRCFVVEPDPDPRLVTLRVELHEGEQTTVDKIEITALLAGMDVETRDEIYDLLITLGFMTEQRQWIRAAGLNIRKIQSIRSILLRYFHREGYLGAKITPICFGETGGPAAVADCTPERLYGAKLPALRFEIEPGPRTEVNGILVRGNLTTRKHVILRELLLEDGGALGTEALFRSQANLRSLGLFDAVSVSTIGRIEGGIEYAHNDPNTVKVVLEEGRYEQLDALIGLQIASAPLNTSELPVLYTLGASYRERNLLGRALEVGVGANHANRIDTLQDVNGDLASWEVGPFFKDRRLLGSRIDFTTTASFEQGRTQQRDAYQQLYGTELIFGYDFFNLSYPAEWGRGLRLQLTVEGRLERRRLLTQLDERPPFADFNNSIGLRPTITWERRDSPLNPTRGWFVSFNTRLVSNDIGTDPQFSYRADLTAQTVHNYFDRRLIIVPTVRLGGILTDQREADLPSDFLFKAGGDGVALPVRGYGDASIEACHGRESDGFCENVFADDDEDKERPLPVGGEALAMFSLELRWPTFVIDDFWFAAFTDIGAVSPEWGIFNERDIFPSVGAGLRWLVTGQIPLRLDIAAPLRDTGLSEQEARVHLNIFYTL